MDKQQTNSILNKDYPKLLEEVIDHILLHDLVPEAFKLLKVLEQALLDNMNELKVRSKLLSFYKKEILKLKFICLPLLDDKVVTGLIKNNFLKQFDYENYSLLEKIKSKLLTTLVVEDRNKLKENLKDTLLKNQERIISNHETKTVQDWLKNYVSRVGMETDNNLIKAQYLTNLKNDKNINPKEFHKLSVLFELYDKLNIPSDAPQGFEEEIPISIEGKLYIFRKGVLEEVPELGKEYKEAKELLEAIQTGKDDGKKNIISKSSVDHTKITELEKALDNYSADSLEHRAIKQEIDRLKKAK